jgi:hypothetical protein
LANISMTETALQCHPLSEKGFVDAIAVHVDRAEDGRLQIKYTLHGVIDGVHFPEATQRERTDGLWKGTCFELFCGPADEGGYVEFNFAPSGQWAAYAFTGYREGMTELACAPPQINCTAGEGIFEMTVTVDLPESLRTVDLAAGFSAVIADKDGRTAYWALAHPPGKADFHHKDCFALQLEARSAA